MDEFVVGLRLMKVREHKGLTQEQVAKKAQLNLDDYIAMEGGKKLESKEKLEKACAALDINVEDLFDATTYINYSQDENTGAGSGGFCNSHTFSNSNLDDRAVIEEMAENLKYLMENLDFIKGFVKVMYENAEDTVFKNRLKEVLKEHKIGKGKK